MWLQFTVQKPHGVIGFDRHRFDEVQLAYLQVQELHSLSSTLNARQHTVCVIANPQYNTRHHM